MNTTLAELLQRSPLAKHWREQITKDNVMAAIDTGSAQAGRWSVFDFRKYLPIEHALDLGCGVGRNIEGIRRHCGDYVIGYDLPERIPQMVPEWQMQYEAVYSAWPAVLNYRYHTVVAIHVLQHINVDVVRQMLTDLRNTSPGHRLLLGTRWWSDDCHFSMRKLVADYYTGIPGDHCTEMDENHWYAILRSV